MAGTLVISTLSDGTNSTSSTNCIQGSAKAWVNANGSVNPATIRASYNVSSVTYNGGGSYYVNFTTAMSDANYAIAGMCAHVNGTTYANDISVNGNYTLYTTYAHVQTDIEGSAWGGSDNPIVSVIVFR